MELQTGHSVSIPVRRRLWLWRHGFTSRFDVLFDVTSENHHRFLSDYQEGFTPGINQPWKSEMDNKLATHLLLLPFAEHLPRLFGILDEGDARLYPAYEGRSKAPVLTGAETIDGFERYDARTYVDELLHEHEAIVLKAVTGSGGRDVYIIRLDQASGDYSVNGSVWAEERFESFLNDVEMYLATEYIEQSPFMDDLFADATNTIRVVTMWDYDADEPFIAWAHARIGTVASAPLDNISQGGLQAGIDLDTGELLYAADVTDKTSPVDVKWYDAHPTTGNRLVGRTIPDWDEIADEVVRMAEGFPQLPYIGWDVLLTREGDFKILELNSSPGMINTQVHSRVLDDPRVRQFYEHHDVL